LEDIIILQKEDAPKDVDIEAVKEEKKQQKKNVFEFMRNNLMMLGNVFKYTHKQEKKHNKIITDLFFDEVEVHDTEKLEAWKQEVEQKFDSIDWSKYLKWFLAVGKIQGIVAHEVDSEMIVDIIKDFSDKDFSDYYKRLSYDTAVLVAEDSNMNKQMHFALKKGKELEDEFQEDEILTKKAIQERVNQFRKYKPADKKTAFEELETYFDLKRIKKNNRTLYRVNARNNLAVFLLLGKSIENVNTETVDCATFEGCSTKSKNEDFFQKSA